MSLQNNLKYLFLDKKKKHVEMQLSLSVPINSLRIKSIAGILQFSQNQVLQTRKFRVNFTLKIILC